MSRYRIALGKKAPTHEEEEAIPVKDIPRRIKELQRWDDRFASIIKEISPRNSTCKSCRKVIERGTPRYSCYDNRGKYFHQGFFHLKCLPPGFKKFIRDFPKRDLAQESIDRIISKICEEVDQLPDTADEQGLLEKLVTFIRTWKP